jgi:hypothetical protein
MALLPFFEEQENPQNEATPSLAELLRQAMEATSSKIRVSCPGEVVKYDFKKQLADVRPDFDRKYSDGKVVKSPIIYNVPVKHPRAFGCIIHLPLKKGDKVELIFSDRSLENWLSNGKAGAPPSKRAHHISDATAYPGLYPFSDAAKVHNGKDLILKNGQVEMRMKPNGKLQVLNSTNELVKLLVDYMKADILGAHHWKVAIQTQMKTFLER